MIREVKLLGVPGFPHIQQGNDLGRIIVECCTAAGIKVQQDDVFVIAQKVVSKAEGAILNLADITPSPKAQEIAKQTGRDPRLCQVILNESTEIVFVKGRVVVTRHRLGFRCSSAGIDSSNIGAGRERVSLLPQDPDLSARLIRSRIQELTKKRVAVIVNDSFGKDDREGSIGVAIGIAGIAALESDSRKQDIYGNQTGGRVALIDEMAAAASIVMGAKDAGYPAVLVRGVSYTVDETTSIKNILVE